MLMHDLVTHARIQPACNQIEVHAYYQRENLVNYCLSRNICVTAHTQLEGGLLNSETWNAPIPLKDDIIVEIAKNHGKSPAQVLLRFLLQRGVVFLPKSVKPHRMAENKDILDFSLTADGMKKIVIVTLDKECMTNKNPLSSFLGGPDAFSEERTEFLIE